MTQDFVKYHIMIKNDAVRSALIRKKRTKTVAAIVFNAQF